YGLHLYVSGFHGSASQHFRRPRTSPTGISLQDLCRFIPCPPDTIDTPYRKPRGVSFSEDHAVSRKDRWRRKLCLHGLAVEMECGVRALVGALDRLAEPFSVAELPEGFSSVSGSIGDYSEREVLPHLSSSARRLSLQHPWLEVYQESERFW